MQRIIEVGCRRCGNKEEALCKDCRRKDFTDDVYTELKEIKEMLKEKSVKRFLKLDNGEPYYMSNCMPGCDHNFCGE